MEKGGEALLAGGDLGVAGGVVGEHAVVVEEGVDEARGLGGDGHRLERAVVEVVLAFLADGLGVGVAEGGFADQDLVDDGPLGRRSRRRLDELAVGKCPFADVTELAYACPDFVGGCVDVLGQDDSDVVRIGYLQRSGRGTLRGAAGGCWARAVETSKTRDAAAMGRILDSPWRVGCAA